MLTQKASQTWSWRIMSRGSNALHACLGGKDMYLTGPLSRYASNYGQLSPLAREVAARAGLGTVCNNPFKSITVRGVELVYACEEALRLIEAYEPPDPPAVAVPGRAGIGHGASEAPRGLLFHRYELDDEGLIRAGSYRSANFAESSLYGG